MFKKTWINKKNSYIPANISNLRFILQNTLRENYTSRFIFKLDNGMRNVKWTNVFLTKFMNFETRKKRCRHTLRRDKAVSWQNIYDGRQAKTILFAFDVVIDKRRLCWRRTIRWNPRFGSCLFLTDWLAICWLNVGIFFYFLSIKILFPLRTESFVYEI